MRAVQVGDDRRLVAVECPAPDPGPRQVLVEVSYCGICGSDNLDLASRVAQGKFKYTSIKCRDCRADITFGKREDDDQTYFLRRRESGELDWKAFSSDKTDAKGDKA